MTWTIRVPVLEHDVVDATRIADVAGYVDNPEDRAVTRELFSRLTLASPDGKVSAQGVCDGLSEATAEQRRHLLDELRHAAGLATTKQVDSDAHLQAITAGARRKAGEESPWQLCNAPFCNAQPINHLGAPTTVNVRRWFCGRHKNQATPDDLKPAGPELIYTQSGTIIDAREQAAETAKAKQHEHTREAIDQQRRSEAAIALADNEADQAALNERYDRELPPHLRT